MIDHKSRPLYQLPRYHLLIGVSADSTFAATIVYAIAAHVALIDVVLASRLASIGACITIMVGVYWVTRGGFDPKVGTLLRASPRTVGLISAALAVFALGSLLRFRQAESAYLPSVAAACCAALTISGLKSANCASEDVHEAKHPDGR